MNINRLILTVTVLLTSFVPGVQAEDPFALAWDITELTDTWHNEIQVETPSGEAIRWLKVDQLTMAERVFGDIERAAEIHARLLIVPGDQPNAMAGTTDDGNIIGINFAMLDALGMDESQFAALFGHELAHLKLEHGRQAGKRNLPATLAMSAARVLVSNPLGELASAAFVAAVTTRYGREAERESDYLGSVWAVQAKYSAWGAVRLQQTLGLQNGKHPLPFLSTHPKNAERLATLDALAKRLSPSGAATETDESVL